ncbi:MAG TPA: hypothetical protein ENJ85_00905 [Oceanithermus profundus]|uniref:Lipoprotein n=1 Tax=Oceanithermus profundus TaxID=187137 RepID=A0A7C5WR51_9DEIN|nr:hypothetical protein [Oceanithermus profundus]
MKRFALPVLVGLAAALALSSCDKAPLNVPLRDFSISVDATANTLGKVVYPWDAAQFAETKVGVKTITLSGKMTAHYTSLTGDALEMTFYARTQQPDDQSGCTAVQGIAWVCETTQEKKISRSYTFTNGETQAIELGVQNPDVLASGLNQGYLWIGAEVTSGVATNVRFDFTDMVAHVSLF